MDDQQPSQPPSIADVAAESPGESLDHQRDVVGDSADVDSDGKDDPPDIVPADHAQ